MIAPPVWSAVFDALSICSPSSADINPIGGISKTDLKKFIAHGQTHFNLPVLERYWCNISSSCAERSHSFITAVPTAELEPITESYVQSDEVRSVGRFTLNSVWLNDVEADMGMTYEELSVFGRLRKVEKCGPYTMFTKLLHEWGSRLSPTQASLFALAVGHH